MGELRVVDAVVVGLQRISRVHGGTAYTQYDSPSFSHLETQSEEKSELYIAEGSCSRCRVLVLRSYSYSDSNPNGNRYCAQGESNQDLALLRHTHSTLHRALGGYLLLSLDIVLWL